MKYQHYRKYETNLTDTREEKMVAQIDKKFLLEVVIKIQYYIILASKLRKNYHYDIALRRNNF